MSNASVNESDLPMLHARLREIRVIQMQRDITKEELHEGLRLLRMIREAKAVRKPKDAPKEGLDPLSLI